MKNYKKIDLTIVKHLYTHNSLSTQKSIKILSYYLKILRYLEQFDFNFISKICKLEKKYLESRKKSCLQQFILRSLNYDVNKIKKYNKNLITGKGNLIIKNNFLYPQKKINMIRTLKNLRARITLKLKNINFRDKIGIYGYGAIGHAVINFLKKKNYKEFIIFDDSFANSKSFFNRNLVLVKKILICLPHKYDVDKIYLKLIRKKFPKKNILRLVI
jgi:hypothetical protein